MKKLRDALNLRARVTGSVPCERQVRGRLFTFYDWCAQHDDIPELATPAATISRWEDEITAAGRAVASVKTWRMLSGEGGRYRAPISKYGEMLAASPACSSSATTTNLMSKPPGEQ